MAHESQSDNSLKVLLENLVWISPLLGGEQILGSLAHFPYSSWRLGVGLMALSLASHQITKRWDSIEESVGDFRLLRIIRLPRPEKIDIVKEGQQREVRHQIRSHILSLIQKHLIQSHDATERAIRVCVGQLPDERIVSELVRVYEYLLSDSRNKNAELNVLANRSLQETPEENKASIEMIVERLVDAVSNHLRLCRALDGLAEVPNISAALPAEVVVAIDTLELFKNELRKTAYMEGFNSVRDLSQYLQPRQRAMPP